MRSSMQFAAGDHVNTGNLLLHDRRLTGAKLSVGKVSRRKLSQRDQTLSSTTSMCFTVATIPPATYNRFLDPVSLPASIVTSLRRCVGNIHYRLGASALFMRMFWGGEQRSVSGPADNIRKIPPRDRADRVS